MSRRFQFISLRWLACHVVIFLVISRFNVWLLALHIACAIAFEVADELWPLSFGSSQEPRKRNAFCSFCRNSYKDVGPLVEGPDDVFICWECVRLCDQILDQEERRRSGLGNGSESALSAPQFELECSGTQQ